MGYLNDLINKGAFKSPGPLLGSAPTPPASIAKPAAPVIPHMIARPAAPKPAPALNYAKPAVTTTPAYLNRAPLGISNPGTVTGGGGSTGQATSQAVRAQPIDYSQFTDGMADTDSPFVEQKAMFNNALDKFLLENKRQSGIVTADADTALAGIDRNRTAGLTSLNEDLAARGLGRGGIQLSSVKDASDQYARQKTTVGQGRDRSLEDLASRETKMRADTGNSIQAARREAYNRLVAKQELI